MKPIVTAALLLLSSVVFCQPVKFAGNWEGKITAQLNLLFHLTASGDSLSGTLDSPAQGVFNMPLTSVSLQADTLTVTVQQAHAVYRGLLVNDSSINGLWQQGKANIPLAFKRATAGASVKTAAQTPLPPFPYQSDSVRYSNADNSVQYGATFTYPHKSGVFPAVILITGSGTQDRDESIGQHKPFAVIADYLTRSGIAVLRVDDRGAGLTTLGNHPTQLTTASFAADVEAGIAYLQQRKEVNKKQLGLIGHSEGGLIAPMLASRRKDIAFIVLLAGPGIPGDSIFMPQLYRQYIRSNLAPAEEQKAEAMVNKLLAAFKQDTAYAAVCNNIRHSYTEWKKGLPDSTEKRLVNATGVQAWLAMADNMRNAAGLCWMNYFLNARPASYLQKVHCPVLAINGEKDANVAAGPNLAAIDAALKQSRNRHFTVASLPNLNHLFQTCNSPQDSYYTLPETFSPAALAVIGNWLNHTLTSNSSSAIQN